LGLTKNIKSRLDAIATGYRGWFIVEKILHQQNALMFRNFDKTEEKWIMSPESHNV
jgi:hypothetical protein